MLGPTNVVGYTYDVVSPKIPHREGFVRGSVKWQGIVIVPTGDTKVDITSFVCIDLGGSGFRIPSSFLEGGLQKMTMMCCDVKEGLSNSHSVSE